MIMAEMSYCAIINHLEWRNHFFFGHPFQLHIVPNIFSRCASCVNNKARKLGGNISSVEPIHFLTANSTFPWRLSMSQAASVRDAVIMAVDVYNAW